MSDEPDAKRVCRIPPKTLGDIYTPDITLFDAVTEENESLCKFLLENDVDPNQTNCDGQTPLHIAIQKNNLPLVTQLLKHKADPNKIYNVSLDSFLNYPRSPLLNALEYNNIPLLTQLLEYKANPNIEHGNNYQCGSRSIFMNFPFYTQYNPMKSLKVLLNYHADVNKTDMHKNTLLHYTVGKSGDRLSMNQFDFNFIRVHVVNLLIEYNADVNAQNNKGETPLMLCDKYSDVCKLLIQYKANINLKNNEGRNALFNIIRYFHTPNYDICKFLVENKSDLHIKDKEGKNIFSYLVDNHDENIRKLLINTYYVNLTNALSKSRIDNMCKNISKHPIFK
tara:strand:- start:42 stop:1052 length:1011 start_codon:yes stop_codon:yes gene_type:complete